MLLQGFVSCPLFSRIPRNTKHHTRSVKDPSVVHTTDAAKVEHLDASTHPLEPQDLQQSASASN